MLNSSLYNTWFEELTGEVEQMVEIYIDDGICPDVVKDMVPVMLADTELIKECYASAYDIEKTSDRLYSKHIMQVNI